MASAVKGVLGALGRVVPLHAPPAPSPSVATRPWTPLLTSVRHRYHADRMAKGPLLRNYGYREQLHNKGLMPHVEHSKRLPIPLFRPSNNWSEKRALFGQNHYIDILGSGNLRPTEVTYSVPGWLRGFKGNEYQMLLRKRKMLGRTMTQYRPSKKVEMNKRIAWLYRYLNRKTKDYWWAKA